LAISQSRPPKEIVVIDASEDWENTKKSVENLFADAFKEIPLIYQKAKKASSTTQRNQGIDAASSDVVFLIDDDSLLYPGAAEEVMKVYEADTEKRILGASPVHESSPPPDSDFDDLNDVSLHVSGNPKQTSFRRIMKAILNADGLDFLPYHDDFPKQVVPESLKDLHIAPIKYMTGSSMTFRKDIFEKERFCEVLLRYAAGEDQDFSYRVSTHGLIVNVIDAKLCHLEISGGRMSRYTVSIVQSLNPAVMQQLYSPQKQLMNKRWKRILWRRLLISCIKQVADRQWDFDEPRGIFFAIRTLGTIQKMPLDELADWYEDFQLKLFSA
jgi:glycosyltransferase involved in cell wall biosynthesis